MARLLVALLVALLTTSFAAAAERGSTRLGRPASDAAAKRAVVDRVFWERADGRARLVVTIRGSADYSTHIVGADAAAGMPPRVYVDLRPAMLGKDVPRTAQAVEDPIAIRARVGQFDLQTVRVVVDLSEPALFEVRTGERPPRLLLGLRPRPADTPRTAATVPEVGPTPAVRAIAPPAPTAARVAAPRDTGATPGGRPERGAAGRVALAPTPTAKPEERPSPARERAAAGVPSDIARARAAAEKALAPSPTPVAVAARATPKVPAAATAVPRGVPPAEATTASEPPRGEKEKVARAATERVRRGRDDEKRAGHDQGAKRGRRAAKQPRTPPAPRVWTVVLDPGHGGRDPGARGVTGDEEKEITLTIARLIAEMLADDPRIRVVLTRLDDSYVSLEQRTAIANAQGADIFLSIHANASENPRLAGVETYTLNNTDDRATIRLAALENGLTLTGAAPGERDLAYILSDLVQTGKEDESVSLARAVQDDLVSYLRERWRGVSNLGVKKGPFYVLVGAYMPCVLVEVAFLTNETEGQRISARRYQLDVAEGIARGIRRFLASENANANL